MFRKKSINCDEDGTEGGDGDGACTKGMKAPAPKASAPKGIKEGDDGDERRWRWRQPLKIIPFSAQVSIWPMSDYTFEELTRNESLEEKERLLAYRRAAQQKRQEQQQEQKQDRNGPSTSSIHDGGFEGHSQTF